MIKYYTRACNFYHGTLAKRLLKKKLALPLCGKKNIAFDKLEIFIRKNGIVSSKYIFFKDIRKLGNKEQKIIKRDLKNITKKRKNFLKNIKFETTSLMGILNLTPDSFSDGGKFNKKKNSVQHLNNLVKFGADIIDVGGESTRPGAQTINPKKEWKRVQYIIKNFKKKFKNKCLSIDTRKSDLMIKAIKFGADLINDVSGFDYDKSSLLKLNKYKIPKVVHHMQGTPKTMQNSPKYKNVLLDIYDFFEKKIKNDLKDNKIILDPGIGFGKTLKHNLTLISKISLFHSLGLPILVGTSRKKFINQITGQYDSKDRTGGTLASVLYLMSQGVQIFRVHNVNEVKQGILVFKKILLEK